MPSTPLWGSCTRDPSYRSTPTDEPPQATTSLPRPRHYLGARTAAVQPLLSPQFGPCREMGPPLPVLAVAPALIPGRKRALEAQERAQLSFLPVLLQVRVARGGTEPGRHFTSSEGHAPAGDDKRGRPWLAQPGDVQGTPAPSQVMGGFTGEERVPERSMGTLDQHPKPSQPLLGDVRHD